MAHTDGHTPAPPHILHATSLAVDGRGVLLTGASGSGKSTLALQMMAFGAQLICDDRTHVTRTGDTLEAAAAPNISGLIEARGIGVLRALPAAPAPVVLIVDLDERETERIPPPRIKSLLGVSLPCIHKVEAPHFPAAVVHYLRHGLAS